MGEQSSSANLADFFGDIIEEAGIGDIAKEVGLPFGGSRSGESDSNAFASMMGGESSSQGAYGDTGAMGIPYAAAFSASNAARSRRGSRFYTYCRFCKGKRARIHIHAAHLSSALPRATLGCMCVCFTWQRRHDGRRQFAAARINAGNGHCRAFCTSGARGHTGSRRR